MTTPNAESQPPRPTARDDFEIAVICALPLEADAVDALFDHYWDEDGPSFDKAPSDPNAYSTGAIGRHNVVLAHMPGMGKANAAIVANNCRTSFPNIKLALVVGVSGVVPFRPDGEEIILGDVIISDGVIQYDLGRQLPGRFVRKDTLLDALGRPNLEIRSVLAKLKGLRGRKKLADSTIRYLDVLQLEPQLAAKYPGALHDNLFEATYCHIGDKETCHQSGCSGTLVPRRRIQTVSTPAPAIHFGLIASGDSVMKSGEDRDTIAKAEGVIAFEMEGAGVWETLPCVVIKGACDYADSHKSKSWQRYAAATAAACMKAFLKTWVPSRVFHSPPNPEVAMRSTVDEVVETTHSTHQPCYYIQLAKNPRFIGRTSILNKLEEKFFGNERSQKAALVGLGGVGKTQIALRFAYEMKERRPEYSIFWVPLLSDESAQQAFVEIANKLGLQKKRTDDDIKELVCQHLSSSRAGKWLFVIDNADDQRLVSGSMEKPGLEEYFPASENGILFMTTRSGHVAEDFAGPDVLEVEQMDQKEATDLFREHLSQKKQLQDEVLVAKLLSYLTFLPLAITQAASYLNQTKAPIKRYFALLQEAEKDLPSVLGREFKDTTRYKGSRNAVGKTWLVSFQQIEESDQVAVRLLRFISCIEPKAIPQAMIPDAGSEKMEWAVGALCAYSFLVRQGDTDMLDMHSLVHMATRGWVEEQGWRVQITNDAVSHLVKIFPSNTHANRELRRKFVPHATRLLEHDIENRPSNAHRLYQHVGDCHYTERQFKEAVQCYETVCWWRRTRVGEDDGDRLQSEHALASAYLGDRRIKDAIEIFEHVLAVRKEILDEKDYSRLTSEYALARAYLDDRRIKDAIEIFEHVLAVQKETLDETDHFRLTSEHALASAYLDDRRIKDAIEIFEHVLAVRKKTLDEKDYSRLALEHELARAYLGDRRIKDAIEMIEHVVAVQKETLDEKDHFRLASEHELASAYLDDRRIKDAIEIFEHVVAMQKETLDETDHSRLMLEHALASAYLADRRIKDAIEIFEHVVAVQKETLDGKDYSRLASEHELASAYLADRRIKDAIKIFEHVVAVQKETLDEKDHFRLASEYALASAYLGDRRIKDAIEIFEHVVAVQKETLDEKDHSRLTSEHALASAYLADRRIKDAIEIFEYVVAVQKETLDGKDYSRLASEHELASAYLGDRRIKDAIKIFEHVVAVQKETLDEKDHFRLTSEYALASAYLGDRQIKDAIEIFEHVVAVQKETLDEKDHFRLASEYALAKAYTSKSVDSI